MVVEGSDKELDPFWIELSQQSKIDGNHNDHQLTINKLNLITDWIKKTKERKIEEFAWILLNKRHGSSKRND